MYFALPKFLFLNRPRGMQRKGLCTFGSRQDPTNTNTPSLQCCLGESQCNSGWDGFGDFRNSRYTVVLGKCIPHPKIGKMKILTPPPKKCLSVTLNRRQQYRCFCQLEFGLNIAKTNKKKCYGAQAGVPSSGHCEPSPYPACLRCLPLPTHPIQIIRIVIRQSLLLHHRPVIDWRFGLGHIMYCVWLLSIVLYVGVSAPVLNRISLETNKQTGPR